MDYWVRIFEVHQEAWGLLALMRHQPECSDAERRLLSEVCLELSDLIGQCTDPTGEDWSAVVQLLEVSVRPVLSGLPGAIRQTDSAQTLRALLDRTTNPPNGTST